MENSPCRLLETVWLCDKQLWNRKIKRIPRADIPSETEESLNYDDNRQFPRISDTRFISKSRKLPPMTIIRRHDLARFDLSDKSKLDSAKPRVLISIGIQEETNANYDLQENCSTRKNYCKQNWLVQQPFYVEEPRWVDIDVDYIDSSNIDNSDPYVLTRGKKIYRINDPEQARKTIEATLNYPNKNKKLLIKSRVRRFAEMNEGSQDKTADEKNSQIKEKNHYDSFEDIDRDTNNTAIIEIENTFEKPLKIGKLSEDEKTESTNYVFNKKYKKADLKNLVKRSSRNFTKQNQISRNNHGIIMKFIKQKEKIQREDILNDTDGSKIEKIDQVKRFNNRKSHFAINNINKKFILLKDQELPKIRKKREIYDTNFKKNVEKNETDTYELIKNKDYVEKLNDFGTPDNRFILSQNKDLINGGIESLNKIDTDRNKFIEKIWKLHYAHRKKLEESEAEAKNKENKSEINNNIGITDSQLINEYNSINSERKISNNREKRNICKDCQITSEFQENERLKEIEKKIQLSLERRDKHSDILEHLSQSEPYIISRGKKTLQDFETKDLFSSNPRNMNDENRVKMISPIAKTLRTLLMEIFRCNNNNFNIKANELSNQRLSPRDRRGTLDEILAAYDPYYVARGKRMNQNQKNVLFETDTRQ
ncbi:hypothetical protein ALC56_06060 [Trachymyrmex septentrionalis]|uniref:Uncharacterized protein n=2 Tax=Trachymyrmex septentrionalis TaxID=34720 RepID=A0A195FGR2_9HYME|nr:hypothetical protein ALC56_06060 [Trachymyrmex septentrionalis]